MSNRIAAALGVPPRLDHADLVRRDELGRALGTSQWQVLKWMEREDFPDPVMWLQARPVWDRAELEHWAAERKPSG